MSHEGWGEDKTAQLMVAQGMLCVSSPAQMDLQAAEIHSAGSYWHHWEEQVSILLSPALTISEGSGENYTFL